MSSEKTTTVMREFPREWMLDLLYEESDDGGAIVSDEITGKTRWGTRHTLVFHAPDGKLYRTDYEAASGDGESQPWQYLDHVRCTEVVAVTRPAVVYEDVLVPVVPQ